MRQMHLFILTSLCLFLCLEPISIRAQESQVSFDDSPWFRSSWFRYVAYGQSLYADEHPDCFRVDIAPGTMYPAFDYSGNYSGWKVQVFAVFGANINLWDGEFDHGRFGLNVSQIASANLWMDFLESTTSPVVNTDYRVSAPTSTFIHRLWSNLSGETGAVAMQPDADSRPPFLRNYSISFCPFKHESTHIGDEMVLQRSDLGYSLRRVNVSYNYAQLVCTLNEPENRYLQTHTFRLGLMVLLNPSKGWYFIESRDGDVNRLPSDKPDELVSGGNRLRYGPSNMPLEMFLQYQFQSACSRHGFQALVSAEVRNRAMYSYSLIERQADVPASAQPLYTSGDARRFTFNMFVGARYNMPNYDGYFSRFAVGVRAYYGNCPYGMFRSVDHFSHVGLCVIYQ